MANANTLPEVVPLLLLRLCPQYDRSIPPAHMTMLLIGRKIRVLDELSIDRSIEGHGFVSLGRWIQISTLSIIYLMMIYTEERTEQIFMNKFRVWKESVLVEPNLWGPREKNGLNAQMAGQQTTPNNKIFSFSEKTKNKKRKTENRKRTRHYVINKCINR
jgi:hypothetical protein